MANPSNKCPTCHQLAILIRKLVKGRIVAQCRECWKRVEGDTQELTKVVIK